MIADHFSTQAGDYRKYRPGYPVALYEYLASLCPGRALAWDSGTGNGQAATALAYYFEKIIATDPNAKQLANAAPRFVHEEQWTLERFTGYLSTWSSVKYFREQRGSDPIAPVRDRLQQHWPMDSGVGAHAPRDRGRSLRANIESTGTAGERSAPTPVLSSRPAPPVNAALRPLC